MKSIECRVHIASRYWEFSRPERFPVPDDQFALVSIGHYCKFCQRFWSWVEVSGATQAICCASSCEDCFAKWQADAFTSEFYFPGSVLNGLLRYSDFDRSLLESLPEELLLREFKVHLRAYEKELEPHGT